MEDGYWSGAHSAETEWIFAASMRGGRRGKRAKAQPAAIDINSGAWAMLHTLEVMGEAARAEELRGMLKKMVEELLFVRKAGGSGNLGFNIIPPRRLVGLI